MQKVLGCFQEWLAYSAEPMEDITGEKNMIEDENSEEHLTMEQWERDAEDESREYDRKKMRRDILKCIKGKTLSEAKELVFLIKYKMPLNRRLN